MPSRQDWQAAVAISGYSLRMSDTGATPHCPLEVPLKGPMIMYSASPLQLLALKRIAKTTFKISRLEE